MNFLRKSFLAVLALSSCLCSLGSQPPYREEPPFIPLEIQICCSEWRASSLVIVPAVEHATPEPKAYAIPVSDRFRAQVSHRALIQLPRDNA